MPEIISGWPSRQIPIDEFRKRPTKKWRFQCVAQGNETIRDTNDRLIEHERYVTDVLHADYAVQSTVYGFLLWLEDEDAATAFALHSSWRALTLPAPTDHFDNKPVDIKTPMTTPYSNTEELGNRIALVNAYVLAEMHRAMAKHEPYNSFHEASAVVREEYEEMWDEIKADDHQRAVEEAVQLAATSMRLLVDLAGDLAARLGPIQNLGSEALGTADENAGPFTIEKLVEIVRAKGGPDLSSFEVDPAAQTSAEIEQEAPSVVDVAAEDIPASQPLKPPGPGTFGFLAAMLDDVVRQQREAAEKAAPAKGA